MKKNSAERPDVMKVLADARPDELDPSRLPDPARQRQDYARIVTETVEGPVARRRGGFRPLATVAFAAVTASVVVAVGTFDRQASDDRPTAQPRPSAGTRTPGAAGKVSVDGHIELLSAARKAESSSAGGTYWQTTTQSQYVDVAEAHGQFFAVRDTSTEKWSVGVRPSTESLMVSGLDRQAGPRTAADKARWQAAGSPRTVEIESESAGGTGKRAYKLGTGRPTVLRTNLDDKIYGFGTGNVSYKDLQALPATSDELGRYLGKLYAQAKGTDGAEGGTSGRSTWILRQAGDLVTMPVKPAVRAAAYRVMADLPGVRVVGQVTDPLGRQGVGVEYPGTYHGPLGTTKQRLVIDPATGAMLGDQLLLVTPTARATSAGLKAGTTLNYQATTRMSWGEHQIDVPKNAHS